MQLTIATLHTALELHDINDTYGRTCLRLALVAFRKFDFYKACEYFEKAIPQCSSVSIEPAAPRFTVVARSDNASRAPSRWLYDVQSGQGCTFERLTPATAKRVCSMLNNAALIVENEHVRQKY